MFASIFIPDFAAEAVMRRRPELRHCALAIIEGEPPLAYVVCVNAHARAVGVSSGMTKLQAEGYFAALRPNDDAGRLGASSAPSKPRIRRAAKNEMRGIIVQRSADCESSAHAALMDAAHAVSPKVEDTAADTVVLDIRGLDRLYGSPQQIAHALATKVGDQGLEGNIAVAATPETAILAARGFTGTTILRPGEECDRLGPLPLDVLFAAESMEVARTKSNSQRRGPKEERDTKRALDRLAQMQETLDRWGVRNFRGLAMLPPSSLSERLGAPGVRLQQLAAGELCRELLLSDPPLTFEESMEFDSGIDRVEPLLFVVGRLIDQVCARLSARALCTCELRIRMKLERHAGDESALSREELDALGNGAEVERAITLPVAMNDAKLFLKLLHLQMSSRPPGGPVVKLWMRAEAAPPRIAQSGLFMPLSPEPEKLELTLARLHKMLGSATHAGEIRAGCAERTDTHAPEAFQMVRFRTSEADSRSAAKTCADGPRGMNANDPTLALRRMRPPIEAEVLLRDGHPARVTCEGDGNRTKSHDNVVWSAGPWRTSGAWWATAEPLSDVAIPNATVTSEAITRTLSDETYGGARDVADRVANTSAPWSREEWDVALAVTSQQPRREHFDGRDLHKSGGRRSRATEIVLYRVVKDVASGKWFVEGTYD